MRDALRGYPLNIPQNNKSIIPASVEFITKIIFQELNEIYGKME